MGIVKEVIIVKFYYGFRWKLKAYNGDMFGFGKIYFTRDSCRRTARKLAKQLGVPVREI